MNHKYSTQVLIGFLFIFAIVLVGAIFTTDDIDELCSDSETLLYRNSTDWGCQTIKSNFGLVAYDAEPARGSESNIHGGILSLATAQTIDGSTNGTATQGIGKMLIVIINASDSSGTLNITGTAIDRNTGATTADYIDSIAISGVSSDDSTTDGNSNSVHNFSDAYITNVWFSGAVEFYSSNLNMDDVDIYHVSFEQLNDLDGSELTTLDMNLLATNVNAEVDTYLYRLIKDSNSKVEISSIAELHLGNLGVTPVANKYYRLRKGNIGQDINGTKDGFWVDVHYSNSPAYVEDVTTKVWGTQEITI